MIAVSFVPPKSWCLRGQCERVPSAVAKKTQSSPLRRCRCPRVEKPSRKTAWSESGCPSWRWPTLGCLPRRRWDSPSPAWRKGCSQRCHGAVDRWESWGRERGALRSDAYRLRRTELHEEELSAVAIYPTPRPLGDGGRAWWRVPLLTGGRLAEAVAVKHARQITTTREAGGRRSRRRAGLERAHTRDGVAGSHGRRKGVDESTSSRGCDIPMAHGRIPSLDHQPARLPQLGIPLALQLVLLLAPPQRQAMKETQLVLSSPVEGHLVLELAALLGKGAGAVVNPLVAVDLGALVSIRVGRAGDDAVDVILTSYKLVEP